MTAMAKEIFPLNAPADSVCVLNLMCMLFSSLSISWKSVRDAAKKELLQINRFGHVISVTSFI